MRRSLLRGSPTRERTAQMSELQSTPNTIELAAEIVSAFVSNNSVPAVELPTLIGSVHDALTKAANGLAQQPAEEPKAPAVSIKKSVQPDYIVCLDDGKTRPNSRNLSNTGEARKVVDESCPVITQGVGRR